LPAKLQQLGSAPQKSKGTKSIKLFPRIIGGQVMDRYWHEHSNQFPSFSNFSVVGAGMGISMNETHQIISQRPLSSFAFVIKRTGKIHFGFEAPIRRPLLLLSFPS
jgi:hypothetical protein